jgi:hypothetical protein
VPALKVARALLCILAGLGAAASCAWNPPFAHRFGYEADDDKCTNGIDDDYNGLIDCEDPSCFYRSTQCGEYVPNYPVDRHIENTVPICTDHIDNDENGKFDCADPNCGTIQNLCCSLEFTDAFCSDGIDNDQNGFADCLDFGCKHGLYVSVCSERTDLTCGDGVDNDKDGKVDCQQSSCFAKKPCQAHKCEVGEKCFASVENTFALCTDGNDNDGTGFADCNDANCCPMGANGCALTKIPGLAAFCGAAGVSGINRLENTLAQCQDGIDNDHDGYADCADFSCSSATSNPDKKITGYCAAIAEATYERCTNGIDDDKNGYADCGDFSCSSPKDAKLQALMKPYCDAVLERTPEKCNDGTDNDGNGYIDCADDNCSGSSDPKTQEVCWESLPGTNADPKRCQDGQDNDHDGFIDCDDWDCAWNPKITVTDAKGNVLPLCPEPRPCQAGGSDKLPKYHPETTNYPP